MENKILRVVLSAVIAVALWFYVISVVSPESEETFYDIPVSYQNDVLDERGLMIVSDTPTVTLKLKGNRSDLNELNASNITILVNLAAIQAPGTQMVQYDVSYPANLPSNAFETLSQTPNLLLLKVENKVKKPVPIVLDYMETKVPEGYLADKENPVLDVSYVEVSGPESSVSQITSAVVQVDLTEQTDSIVGTYEYVLCNEAGEPVDAQMVTTNVENINLSVKIQRVKEVNLQLDVIYGGGAGPDNAHIALSTETIRLSGGEAVLEELGDTITLGRINLAEITKAQTLTFPITLPEGVTNLTGVAEVEAEISFQGLSTREFTVETITVTNVPEGMEAELITEKLQVTVRGITPLVTALTEEDISVTVDLTGAEADTSTFKATVVFSEKFSAVGALGTYSVSVIVREK